LAQTRADVLAGRQSKRDVNARSVSAKIHPQAYMCVKVAKGGRCPVQRTSQREMDDRTPARAHTSHWLLAGRKSARLRRREVCFQTPKAPARTRERFECWTWRQRGAQRAHRYATSHRPDRWFRRAAGQVWSLWLLPVRSTATPPPPSLHSAESRNSTSSKQS